MKDMVVNNKHIKIAHRTYLMLRNGGNFGILRLDSRAEHACQSDLAGVAFQSSVNESADLTVDVTDGFGIRKGLIGGGLVKAVGISDLAKATRSGSVAQ